MRLVGPNGEQVGIVAIGDALRLAQEADLDLVEVAPMARPPVCKLMDYGKFKYESAQKAREARKNQVNTVIKEMKLRPKIDPHDYETKKGHVVRFLKQGDKVKITIMFRGREQSRPELGFRLLQRLAADVAGARLRRVRAEAGRPQHDHGARPAQEEGRGPRRARRRQGPPRRGRAADAEAAVETATEARSRAPSRRAPRPAHRPSRPRPSPPSSRPEHHRTSPRPPPVASSTEHDSRPREHTEENDAMPKNKTHSGTKKRFQLTGTGKVLREQANRRHLLEHKSSTRTRRLAADVVTSKADVKKVKHLLGK